MFSGQFYVVYQNFIDLRQLESTIRITFTGVGRTRYLRDLRHLILRAIVYVLKSEQHAFCEPSESVQNYNLCHLLNRPLFPCTVMDLRETWGNGSPRRPQDELIDESAIRCSAHARGRREVEGFLLLYRE